jgi:5,10-methylene-tetrahydrofolate dehydrogenase/methenyl tetrahydrofolate cyclohydrolase
VTGDMVGEGAVVIVPGGVGPMTRAMLLVNTLKAARARAA